jgi:hypothetical protein
VVAVAALCPFGAVSGIFSEAGEQLGLASRPSERLDRAARYHLKR